MIDDFSGRTETYLGYINGYRHFKVNDGWLHGPATGIIWRPGNNIAKCNNMLHRQDSVPLTWCTCGFYAYHSVRQAKASGFGLGSTSVLAVIEASGICLVGPEGFRAQKARVAAICLPPWRPDRLLHLLTLVASINIWLLITAIVATGSTPVHVRWWGLVLNVVTAQTVLVAIHVRRVLPLQKQISKHYPKVKFYWSLRRFKKDYPRFKGESDG